MKHECADVVRRLLIVGAALPVLLYSYPDGPPAAMTGAPGENTCTNCHRAGSGGGRVEVAFPSGLTYAPGVKQQWTITITDPDARLWGFQLSTRVSGDNSQAGTLAAAPGESGIRVICSHDGPRGAGGCPVDAPIEYIEHSAARQTNAFRVEWTPPANDRGAVRVYVAGNAANGDDEPTGDDIYTASYTLNAQASPSITAPPIITAVVNSASFTPAISPGAFATIFGENLAPVTRSWAGAIQGTQLPAQLEGVSVTVGGRPAYIAHMVQNPSLLNVVLPTDEMSGTVEVRVTTPQGSAAASATVAEFAPAFFMRDQENRKYIAASHGNFDAVARAGLIPGATSRPAAPGEEIALWGTGFGPTAEQVPSGQVVTRPYPLADPADLKVIVGGIEARVPFAGVTIAGVYQIHVVAPPELPDGDHAVVAEIGGVRSQDGAFITIERPQAGTALAGIQVSYRLDPWLVTGTYGGGIWVSPAVFGPVGQEGNTFALEVRAAGFDAAGREVDINPQWTPSDPGMVSVSPAQGKEVRITVLRPGESRLQVSHGGVSKSMTIRASQSGTAMVVEIVQN